MIRLVRAPRQASPRRTPSVGLAAPPALIISSFPRVAPLPGTRLPLRDSSHLHQPNGDCRTSSAARLLLPWRGSFISALNLAAFFDLGRSYRHWIGSDNVSRPGNAVSVSLNHKSTFAVAADLWPRATDAEPVGSILFPLEPLELLAAINRQATLLVLLDRQPCVQPKMVTAFDRGCPRRRPFSFVLARAIGLEPLWVACRRVAGPSSSCRSLRFPRGCKDEL